MSKIEQNKERKRQAIFKAAQGLFLSEGYIRTIMDKIAEEAQSEQKEERQYFRYTHA